jgi:hypothetical protein
VQGEKLLDKLEIQAADCRVACRLLRVWRWQLARNAKIDVRQRQEFDSWQLWKLIIYIVALEPCFMICLTAPHESEVKETFN